MRDDRNKWDALNTFANPLSAQGVMISRVAADHQTLISGKDVLLQSSNALGWPEIARGESYSLILRRDRILVVNGGPVPEGWHDDKQQAVSNATDAYLIFQLDGPRAIEILKQGAAVNPALASASTARSLFGIDAFLYRYDHEACFRLHVSSAQAQAMWKNLESRL